MGMYCMADYFRGRKIGSLIAKAIKEAAEKDYGNHAWNGVVTDDAGFFVGGAVWITKAEAKEVFFCMRQILLADKHLETYHAWHDSFADEHQRGPFWTLLNHQDLMIFECDAMDLVALAHWIVEAEDGDELVWT